MRTSLRLFAAALSTLFAAAFLVVIPSATPAHAIAGFNKVNIGSGSVSEAAPVGSRFIDFPITLTPTGGVDTITATVTTQPDTAFSPADYEAKTETFSWSFNDSSQKTFRVKVNDDAFPELDEKFQVVFTQAPTGADAGTTGTGTINDNDSGAGSVPQISVSGGGSQPEGNADNTRNITVHLDKIYPGGDVAVLYQTLDGTAKSPSDYTGFTTQRHVWPASDNTPDDFVIPVTVKGDTFGEPDEFFQVVFGGNDNAALASNANQNITLTNDDGPAPVVSIGELRPTPSLKATAERRP